MITWVLSYPRSGNTLTRMVLEHCFAIRTDSEFAVAGRRGGPLLAQLRDRDSFVKGHLIDFVQDGDKVIYIARDGRAAISSWQIFEREVDGREVTLSEMIEARPPWQSWSDHVGWALRRSPETTLVLRYEDMRHPSQQTLEQISTFIAKPSIRPFDIPFEQFRQQWPKLCRVGHNDEGIARVESLHSQLFWTTHGAVMRQAGYA